MVRKLFTIGLLSVAVGLSQTTAEAGGPHIGIGIGIGLPVYSPPPPAYYYGYPYGYSPYYGYPYYYYPRPVYVSARTGLCRARIRRAAGGLRPAGARRICPAAAHVLPAADRRTTAAVVYSVLCAAGIDQCAAAESRRACRLRCLRRPAPRCQRRRAAPGCSLASNHQIFPDDNSHKQLSTNSRMTQTRVMRGSSN